MYLSELEEIVAICVCVLIVIAFAVSTYKEIQNTIAEEREKLEEKKQNEEKIKTLTDYINSKNELYKALLKLKKKETDQESSEV
ncbi:hypothetical protein N8873_00950 [Flavobacteriaceae bacterium]|nr:hypothetical protein [Flavobacteriaceae bacterium]